MTTKRAVLCLVLMLALPQMACLRLFKKKVGEGAARLGVRNIGAVMQVIADDTVCGFESPEVLNNPIIEGKIGGFGSVTHRVENCRLEFPNPVIIDTDCNGTTKSVQGAFTVTATKTVTGRVTGSTETPAIPDSPNSAVFNFERIEFEHFNVVDSSSVNHGTINRGSVSAVVSPMLVEDVDGACSIATPNVRFSAIQFKGAKFTIAAPGREFSVDIPNSNYEAVNGAFDGKTNWMSGSISPFGKSKPVARTLNPDFEMEFHENSYQCEDEIAWPTRTTCDITPSVGHGVARLSVRTVAGLVKAVNADTGCGFESDSVLNSFVADGDIGTLGTVTYDLGAAGCTLDYAPNTEIDTDCNGVVTSGSGTAVVRGTKVVTGYITGDPETPVVPASREPADIHITADLVNFEIQDSSSDSSLTIVDGGISGTLSPRTAIDTELGACSISTPVARISDIAWRPSNVQLYSDGARIDTTVGGSALNAINGTIDGRSNELLGSISVNGMSVEVPEDDRALNPDFDPFVFQDSYACTENMEIPRDPEECDLNETLGQNAARLLIRSFGVVNRNLDDNTDCGFASIDGLLPADTTGDPSGMMTARWHVDNCVLDGSVEPVLVAHTCDGTDIFLEGTAEATATKTVDGTIALANPPIFPQTRLSARVDQHQIILRNFAVKEYEEGSTEPAPYLEITYAEMSGTVFPVTGESETHPGAFFIKTPVAGYSGIRIQNAVGILHNEGMQFNVSFQAAEMDAFNGTYNDQSNELHGTLTINGVQIQLPIDDDEVDLDPDFSQEAFDATYECKEDMLELVPTVE